MKGAGATGRVAQGAALARPRAVGPLRPVRRAQRGVRANGWRRRPRGGRPRQQALPASRADRSV